MRKKISWIILDNGDTFEGTPEMFADNFFSNVNERNIRDWAKVNDMKVEIFYGDQASFPFVPTI